ncbi:hypothetical protein D5086_006283 [Populus alba]|uniref:Uncharacterized protein n=1 Tax=Populus alba TaxID=43335 RepID=A0ACC4CLD3_POPAL
MYSLREREQRRIVDQRCEILSHGLGVLEREVDKCRRLFYDLEASWEKEVQRQKDERRRRVAVVIIQKYVCKWLVRRAYLKLSVTTSIQCCWRKVLAIRGFRRLKQEATEVTINAIQDSRANLLEEGGNDTVQPRDTTQVRSIGVRILFLQGCGSWFWEFSSSTRIFNELQYNLLVWQGFINVSESFSSKDFLFILATQGKKGWWFPLCRTHIRPISAFRDQISILIPNTKRNHANDPLEVPIGPIIRARAKKLKEALNELVQNLWSKMDLEGLRTFKEHEGQPLIHLVQVQEEPNSCGTRG